MKLTSCSRTIYIHRRSYRWDVKPQMSTTWGDWECPEFYFGLEGKSGNGKTWMNLQLAIQVCAVWTQMGFATQLHFSTFSTAFLSAFFVQVIQLFRHAGHNWNWKQRFDQIFKLFFRLKRGGKEILVDFVRVRAGSVETYKEQRWSPHGISPPIFSFWCR